MLEGEKVNIRMMRESDLEQYYKLIQGSVNSRGPYYPAQPTAFTSLSALSKRVQEDGFWEPVKRPSMLLVEDKSEKLVGEISWIPGRFDDYEMGWIIYDPVARGKGYATEAAQMVISWMFNGMKINRIIAYVHSDNIASQRIAEKCGFRHEATLQGLWYQHGKYQDLELYRILREELEKTTIS